MVSAHNGWHVRVVDKTLALAARGVLPVWRTTPTVSLFRDAGLSSAEVALKEAKLQFAMRLRTINEQHPLVRRITPPTSQRGRNAGTRQRPRTKVQRLGELLPSVPRPALRPPHFTAGCRTDPTGGIDKETAAAEFKAWWASLPPEDVTIFSDGSKCYVDGERHVGYGYAAYQDGRQIATGYGAINSLSHVFDAEAIGAWKGLQHTIRLPPDVRQHRLWMCIDSTSVIWCLRGDASSSSQWAFHNCQDAMQTHDIRIRWAPGHMGIEGNEAADKLADLGAATDEWDAAMASEPTVSGIRSIFQSLRKRAQGQWWAARATKLLTWYRKWGLSYEVKPLPELDLPWSTLHHLLALRTSHRDFSWYHRKFSHMDALLTCSCGQPKTPEHIALCRKTRTAFRLWPQKPLTPPSNQRESIDYLKCLTAKPADFARFLGVTEFYSRICTR